MISALVFSSCTEIDQKQEEVTLVIEASVIVGQPVTDIKVVRVDEADNDGETLVADAKVKMLSLGQVYELEPIEGRRGYYHYEGKDLEIVEGREYILWVEYGDQVAVTTRVVGQSVHGAEVSGEDEFYVANN